MIKTFALILSILIYSSLFALTGKQIYDKYESSVFRIWAGGHGTGFLLNEDGYILTNAHVTAFTFTNFNNDGTNAVIQLTGGQADRLVDGKERYYVVLQKVGEECFAYKARLVAERRDLDVAILKVENLERKIPIPIAKNDIGAAEYVAAMGFPALNDNLDKAAKLTEYMDMQYITDEVILNELGSRLDKAFPNKIDNEIAKAISVKTLSGSLLTDDESKWLANHSKYGDTIITLINDVSVTEKKLVFSATKNASQKRRISEEFLELATPKIQEGKTESIPVLNPNWGLDNNANVRVIQNNAPIRGGNSGGPLINEKGEFVGINTRASITNEANLSLASHFKEIQNFLDNKKIKYYSFEDLNKGTSQVSDAYPKSYTDNKNTEKGYGACVKIFVSGTELCGVIVSNNGEILIPRENVVVDSEYGKPSIYIAEIGKDGIFAHRAEIVSASDGNFIVLNAGPNININPVTFGMSNIKNGQKIRTVSFESNDYKYMDFIEDMGWKGFSQEESELLKKLKDSSNGNLDKYNKTYFSLLNKFLENAPNTVKLHNASSKNFTITYYSSSISDIQELRLNEAETLKSFSFSSLYFPGAPVFNEENHFIGMAIAEKNSKILAVNSSELSNFLNKNKIPHAIVNDEKNIKTDLNSNSQDPVAMTNFHMDYIYITLIVVAGAMGCIIVYKVVEIYLGRKSPSIKNISFIPPQPDSAKHEEAETSYIPKRILGDSVDSDIKVKIADIDSVVKNINSLLNEKGGGNPANIYKLAKNYRDMQEIAISRLRQCVLLISRGQKQEALQLAITYPSLIESVNALQFEKLEQWLKYCKRAGIPAPLRIDNADIDALNALIDETKHARNIDYNFLRELMAKGKLKDAIDFLEKERSLMPNNQEVLRQLLSVKNKYLDQEITNISLLAQKQEHGQALKRYQALREIIPESIYKKNARCAKMQNYIDVVRHSFAEKDIQDAFEALNITHDSNWRRIYEILDLIGRLTLEFPDLSKYIEDDILHNKQTAADAAKRDEINKFAFRDACNGLANAIKSTNDFIGYKKFTVGELRGKIDFILERERKVKSFNLTYPEKLKKAVEDCIQVARRAIKQKLIARVIATSASISALIATICVVAGIIYVHNRKIDAYNDYAKLCAGIFSSNELADKIKLLDEQFASYLQLPQFVEVKEKLADKMAGIKTMESKCEALIAEIQKINENGYLSFENSKILKDKEVDLQSRYKEISTNLPKRYLSKLDKAYSVFNGIVAKYSKHKERYILEKRERLLSQLSDLSKNLSQKYKKVEQCNDIIEMMHRSINAFEDARDIYAPSATKKQIDKISEYKDILNKAETFHLKFVSAEASILDGGYQSYKDKMTELKSLLEEYKLTGSDTYKSICDIILVVDSLIKCTSSYYINNNRFVADSNNHASFLKKSKDFKKGYSDPLILKEIKDICALPLQNIYSYEYEYYKAPSIEPSVFGDTNEFMARRKSLSPVRTNVVYTLNRVKIDTVDVPGRENFLNFMGEKIQFLKDVTYTYTPIAHLYDSNIPNMTCHIRNLGIFTKEGPEVYRDGEMLVNGNVTPESMFLRIFYKNIYNEKSGELKSKSILDTIDEVIHNDRISIEFKISFLHKILKAMKNGSPFESGYVFSPSLNELYSIFSKYTSDPLLQYDNHWVKVTYIDKKTLKDSKVFIDEIKAYFKKFIAKNIPLREEAAIIMNGALKSATPEIKLLGYIGRDKKVNTNIDGMSGYFIYLKNNIPVVVDNPSKIDGEVFSPVLYIHSLKYNIASSSRRALSLSEVDVYCDVFEKYNAK